MYKTQIINDLMKYKGFKTKAEFARFLGISSQLLSKWIERDTFDIVKMTNAFPEINTNWLITGEGEMLKHIEEPTATEPQPGEQMKFDFSALIRVSEKTAEAVQTIANSNEKMAESNKLLAETNAEMWQTIKGKLEKIEELLEKKGGNVQGIPRVV